MGDREWKFDVDDFDFEEDEAERQAAELEPGSPSAESVIFVLLGAVATVASFAAMFLL